jgi:hypothetical protein
MHQHWQRQPYDSISTVRDSSQSDSKLWQKKFSAVFNDAIAALQLPETLLIPA